MNIPVEQIAEQIARDAHDGQMYDDSPFDDGQLHAERTYVDGHLIPAVNLVRKLGYGPLYIATTWLHDTEEDTWVTPDYLVQRCMPSEVVHAVGLVTKQEGQSEDEYMAGILEDPYAIVAKFADSSVNLANTLLQQPVVSDYMFYKRFRRYTRNVRILGAHLPVPDNPVSVRPAVS